MLETLKKLNPEIRFFDVNSPEFATFGKIVEIDGTAEILEAAKQIEVPEVGSSYLPSVEAFEALGIAKTIEQEFLGTLPSQLGYCWGHNSLLNATEWHKGSEINIATTPLVLFLAHVWDIKDNVIDSSSFTAFYVPAGTTILVYETTLHFCPCEVAATGFGCVVGLPKGTNVPLEAPVQDKVQFRKNKWLLCHVENEGLKEKGVVAGITGTNFELKY